MISNWIGKCQGLSFWLEALAQEGTSWEQVGCPAVTSWASLTGFRRLRLALISRTVSFQGGLWRGFLDMQQVGPTLAIPWANQAGEHETASSAACLGSPEPGPAPLQPLPLSIWRQDVFSFKALHCRGKWGPAEGGEPAMRQSMGSTSWGEPWVPVIPRFLPRFSEGPGPCRLIFHHSATLRNLLSSNRAHSSEFSAQKPGIIFFCFRGKRWGSSFKS